MQFHSQARGMLWTDTPSLPPSPQVLVSEIAGLFLTEGRELVRQARGSRLVLSLRLLSVAVKRKSRRQRFIFAEDFAQITRLYSEGVSSP